MRKCLLLSKQEHVLEQTVSVEVGPPGDSWRAVVWLDHGRDLSQCLQDPWSPHAGTRAWETYFFPVIVHQPPGLVSRQNKNPKLSTNPSSFSTSRNIKTHTTSPAEWKAAQNDSLLPLQYWSRLDRNLARQDALYALSELFQFAAASESQFLNFLHHHIDHELSFIGGEHLGQRHNVSLMNLKHIKTQLTSHGERLAVSLRPSGSWRIATRWIGLELRHLTQLKRLQLCCSRTSNTYCNVQIHLLESVNRVWRRWQTARCWTSHVGLWTMR